MGTNVGYCSSVYRPMERTGLRTGSHQIQTAKWLLLQAAGLAAMLWALDAVVRFFS